MIDPMIEPRALIEAPDAARTRILDASWFLPGDGRNGPSAFAETHIPGAAHIDIDAVADRATTLPHMAPSPEEFEAAMAALGVGGEDQVVAYDHTGVFSAARAWWLMRLMGHDAVRVLDGGLPAWRDAKGAIESGPARPRASSVRFRAAFRAELVVDLEQMRMLVDGGGALILDARPPGRFLGVEPEPRPGLRGGAMPGALNAPYASLLENGRLKPVADLEPLLGAFARDGRRIVCTCGSGVTACVIALALARLGRWDAAVYDGAWAQWGGLSDTAIVTAR